jgi:hypothetical protein
VSRAVTPLKRCFALRRWLNRPRFNLHLIDGGFFPRSDYGVRDLSNLMSALVPKMSALTPIADIHPLIENVRFGPKADVD